MTRGTTPTLIFTVPYAAEEISAAYITFAQYGKTVFEATDEAEIADEQISVTLTQAQTLLLRPEKVSVQLRLRLAGGQAVASQIISIDVADILKEGVI